MTGFWRRLLGGKGETPETTQCPPSPQRAVLRKSTIATDIPLNLSAEAQAEVLNQFRNGANPEKIPPKAWQGFWAEKLGVTFSQAAKALFSEGLLRDASPEAKLSASRNLSELKSLAKNKGLKVSGRKNELAARLADSAGPDLLGELAKEHIWICSDAAQEIVRAHRDLKKDQLRITRLETLDLIKRKRIKEACELVSEYEQAQFYPRGVSVDWSTADKAMYQNLRAVFAAQPKFHKRRFGKVSPELRERAAMSVLWGTSRLEDIFPMSEQAEQVGLFSRMLEFHANYMREVEQLGNLSEGGLKMQCEIIGAEDQNTTCAACLNDNGKVYSLEDVPELPHEHCKCAIGCRCVMVAKLPDDF